MEERRNEFAYHLSAESKCIGEAQVLTLGRFSRIFVRKIEHELEQTTFPDRLLFSWYAHFPHLEIDYAVGLSGGFSKEAEWVVFAPLLSLLTKSV